MERRNAQVANAKLAEQTTWADELQEEKYDEESDYSFAYQLLEQMGAAGTVEFYFTALGVLGKVFLLASHPNAAKIIALNQGETVEIPSNEIELSFRSEH